jgi:cobalt-zinc-cadmium efflux system membrane fusion protein
MITCVVGILLCSCKGKHSDTEEKITARVSGNEIVLDSLQMKNAELRIDTAHTKVVHSFVKASGKVDVPPQSLVSVSFPLGGYLKSTGLLPGSHVSKGEVIAIMEDQAYVQLQQDYLTARAKMEYLSADLQRQKELSDADATSKKNYQLVMSEFKTQQVLIRALAEKLRIIRIDPDKLNVNSISRTISVYSPINGYVSKVNINIGKYVNPADVLFELINPEDIHAAITIFEKDISLFRKGLRGKVALADKPDEWYEVETILVTHNINDERAGMLHCHFEKPRHDLLPGMFLNAVFEIGSQKAQVVPEEAVVRYMGKEYVFTAGEHNRFKLTEVNTNGKENGWIALQTGRVDWTQTRLVVNGAYALLGKLKNRMEEE